MLSALAMLLVPALPSAASPSAASPTPDATCQLAWVAGPADTSLAVPFPGPSSAARVLSRGSMVRTDIALPCANGVPAQVMADNGWYRQAGATHATLGAVGCLEPSLLAPLDGLRLAPQPALHGQPHSVPGPFTVQSSDCSEGLSTDQGPILLHELTRHRVQTAAQSAAVAVVDTAWRRHFSGPAPVAWTDWGRVSLPLSHEFSPQELSDSWQAEALDSPERREKALVAHGPLLDGLAVYAHFLGSDAPRSDRWGTPAAVTTLLDLLATWPAACPGSPASCTAQVGDLAYPSPHSPDPLGHKDHDGSCVDVRLFRSDASRYEAWWNAPDDRPDFGDAYDAELTTAFLLHLAPHASVMHFNDPAVLAAVPGLTPARGHDDHLHVCFAAP